MTTTTSPYAAFDVLALTGCLSDLYGGALESELHTFSYVACLISLYAGGEPEDWGYSFVGTSSGCPHSQAIVEAAKMGVQSAWLVQTGTHVALTDAGREMHGNLRRLSENQARERYLEASVSLVLTFPAGTVRAAMAVEPVLSRVRTLGTPRVLEHGPELDTLREQFEAVRRRIGPGTQALSIPVSIWIAALHHVAMAAQAGESLQTEST